MATTIGRLEFHVGANGRLLIRDLRRIGNRAGVAGGQAAGDGFNRGLGSRFGSNQRLIRSHVGRTIAAWTTLTLAIGQQTATLGSGLAATVTAIAGSLGTALIGALGLAGTAFTGFVAAIGLAINSFRFLREESAETSAALDALASTSEANGRRFAEAWGPSLAEFLTRVNEVFGNTAIVDAFAGAVIRITDAFTGVLNSPAFTLFQEALTTSIPNAVGTLGEGFASVGEGLLAIFAGASPALERFADIFSTWAGNFADTMTELASDGRLQTFFDLAVTSITTFFDLTNSLSGALVTLFTTAAPYGNQILDIITGLLDQWNTWMQSIEGQQALQTWFEQGVVIFEALLPLLGEIGEMFGRLVTPDSVERLVTFFDQLGQFMGPLGELLDLFGRLDILNLFAVALNTIGMILEPLWPILDQIATTIAESLFTAMEELQPSFTRLGEAIGPVLVLFGELIAAALPPLLDLLPSVIDIIAGVIEIMTVFSGIIAENEQALEVYRGVVQTVFDIVGGILQTFLDISSGVFDTVSALLRGDFSGAFQAAEDMVANVLGNMGIDFDEFKGWINDLVNVVVPIFRDINNAVRRFGDVVADVFGTVGDWISGAIGWFNNLFGAANNAAGAASGARSAAGGGGGRGAARMASGGLLNGPRRILAGEAGPEAIVPLRRALSQVDPSVRWLSALAQGMVPRMASGGMVGGGKSVVFSDGAIVVQGAVDPQATAVAVMNRVAERVGN